MESMEIDRGETPSEGDTNKTKPIILILIGLPGSGKSTFCDEVMRISHRPWVRVCQDTIKSGKSGTKVQCLSIASIALKDNKSVFIDRCNIDKDQRADFLKLGSPQTEKHAVVLDLPSKLCISRSVKRTGHEGNLQGGKAAAVVNQMVPKKELPKLSEGFNRITFCQNEQEVKDAVNLYGSFGPLDSLPSGCFGQKSPDTKVQQGIMKFLKKVNSSRSETSIEKVLSLQTNMVSQQSEKKDSGLQTKTGSHCQSGQNDESDNIYTLAFPSISTADFQFDLEKASDIIVEKVEEFVGKIGNARLVLVDLTHRSKILPLVKRKAAQKNIDSDKFFTFVGDITRLFSQRGLKCNVIANAANWRLKPGGGGVNAAIFDAAGPELETATKERAVTLSSGKSVTVPVPSSSPLFVAEGVTHVIHTLGPNMNPNRPDCLNDNYVQGCKLLREAYSSLFEGFVSLVKSNGVVSKRDDACEPERNKKYKGLPQEEFKSGVCSSVDEKKTEGEKVNNSKAWASWAQSLYNVAMHPETHKNVVIDMMDDVVVINDAYPKAQRHVLVLARADGIDSLADIRREHVSLLKKMHDVGLKWAEKFISENNSLLFRLGYHSVPSMRQLHLHVISQDFDSSHLKNKKHWNSFNTPFFLDSVDVVKEVEDVGKVTLKNDNLLAMELRCHRCRSVHPNIPRLKQHIKSCKAPFPAALHQNGCIVSSEGT